MLESEKQTPPISSKQQASYRTEIKQKINVLLWKLKNKQTKCQNNTWYNYICQTTIWDFTMSLAHIKQPMDPTDQVRRTCGEAGDPGQEHSFC